ncbi:hypothetical protein [Streptomyces sp. JHA26]|uniref:hypothetical protein n=1 Tax=Streptomyces sp. JHA26 TaxID=1917143 RepID=UPI00098AD651|nr:hypothetical protein [Streptomyces sp. JHA26]
MAERGPEIIGREILRLDTMVERDGHRMGKERRKHTQTRREALVWALHVVLTNDPATPPGSAAEGFLKALEGRPEGGPPR